MVLKQSTRWTLLSLGSLSLLCAYFAFDVPSAIMHPLQRHMKLSTFQYNILYAVEALPNIILPFFSAAIVRRFGARVIMALVLLMASAGQVATSAGARLGGQKASADDLWHGYQLMIAGRVAFALGTEALATSCPFLLYRWFEKHQIRTATGVLLVVSRLGPVINDYVSPIVLEQTSSVPDVFYFATAMSGVSLVLFAIMGIIDRMSADLDVDDEEQPLMKHGLGMSHDHDAADNEGDIEHRVDRHAGATDDHTLQYGGELDGSPVYDDDTMDTASTSRAFVQKSHILALPPRFWLVCIGTTCFFSSVVPFNYNGGGMLQDQYELSLIHADIYLSIPFIIYAIGSPTLGPFIERIGCRPLLMMTSSIAVALIHMSFNESTSPLLLLISLGIAYVIYASVLWSSLPLIVPPSLEATAFAVSYSVQNIGLLIVPPLLGYLHDQNNCNEKLWHALGSLAILSSICSLVLQITDVSCGGTCHLSRLFPTSDSTRTSMASTDDMIDDDDAEAIAARLGNQSPARNKLPQRYGGVAHAHYQPHHQHHQPILAVAQPVVSYDSIGRTVATTHQRTTGHANYDP